MHSCWEQIQVIFFYKCLFSILKWIYMSWPNEKHVIHINYALPIFKAVLKRIMHTNFVPILWCPVLPFYILTIKSFIKIFTNPNLCYFVLFVMLMFHWLLANFLFRQSNSSICSYLPKSSYATPPFISTQFVLL